MNARYRNQRLVRWSAVALLFLGVVVLAWNGETAPSSLGGSRSALLPTTWPPAMPVMPVAQQDVDGIPDQVPVSATLERLRRSSNPFERARAYRLSSTCSHRLADKQLADRGRDRYRAALPDSPDRGQREAALAAIDLQCDKLVGKMDSAALASQLQEMAADATHGLATPTALGVKLALDRGDQGKVKVLLRSMLRAHDAESILELSTANVDLASESDLREASMLRRAALALLACERDVSDACTTDGMLALKLCAFQARCDGTVVERLMPLLGFTEAELRTSADHLRFLLARDYDSAITYLAGAD